MLIHGCVPDKAAGPTERPAVQEDQDGSDPPWKQAPAEEGFLAFSA